MYQLNLTQFNQTEFLRDYWQKKPVVIRQGFRNFNDPISADEIAGLATQPQVESRLVYHKADNESDVEIDLWKAEFGPFDCYEHLGDKNWSLIVQALDHWSEEAALIIEPFRFIPNWRLDDLMVSFATPGGGVGPHIDLYDVFICQGSGKRRWRVGDRGAHREFAAHDALLHVEPFEAIIDVELNPGDILYIPPSFPHEGVTLETSLSFSVGFRTNSAVSLVSGLADFLIDNETGNELIEDAGRQATVNSAAIDVSDYLLIKEHLASLFKDDALIRKFIGCFLTQSKHELDLIVGDSQFFNDEVSALLSSNALIRLGGLRAFYFTETIEIGICYIDGEEVNFDPSISEAVKLLLDNVELSIEVLNKYSQDRIFVDFVCQQLNAGYWYFSQ